MENFSGFSLNNRYYFGTVSDVDKGQGISALLRAGEVYMVSVKDEAKGDWNKYPPAGLKVLHTTYSPTSQPLFYIVTKE